MTKDYLLIRYATKPFQPLTDLLFEEIIEDKAGAKLAVLPGIVISLFDSALSMDEIKEKLSQFDIAYDLVEVQKPKNPGETRPANDGGDSTNLARNHARDTPEKILGRLEDKDSLQKIRI